MNKTGTETVQEEELEELEYRGLVKGEELLLDKFLEEVYIDPRVVLNSYFEGEDGKGYVKAFDTPAEYMADQSAMGWEDLSNYQAVAGGKTLLTIGEDHCKVAGTPYRDWIEVPIANTEGGATVDALNLLKTLEEDYLLDPDSYYEALNKREYETFKEAVEEYDAEHSLYTLNNYESLKDRRLFLNDVFCKLSEESSFHDNGTFLDEERLVVVWNGLARSSR